MTERHPKQNETCSSRHRVTRWFVAVVAGYLMLGCGLQQCSAQEAALTKEYKIKVAYIYKIALYVSAGDQEGLSSTSQLVIGILGNDPFGKTLDQIAAKRKIHARQIIVRRFNSLEDFEPCHLLFVTKTADQDSIREIMQSHPSVLMVGETDEFEEKGGIFCMYLDAKGRVGIRLNIDAANRGKFKVDARLLRICDVFRDENDGK